MGEYGKCPRRLSHFRADKGHIKDFGSRRLLELHQHSEMSYISGTTRGVGKELKLKKETANRILNCKG